jgi:anti-anti-sigma regulatory factor
MSQISERTLGIRYGCRDGGLYVRFGGEATSESCRAADRLVRDYVETHGETPVVVVDLADCGWVDSTFAGGMVGLHKRLRACGDLAELRLAELSAEGRASLEKMHLTSLLKCGACRPPTHMRALECDAQTAPDREAVALMARAHRELARVDEENRRVFEPIAVMLEAQLAQMPT